jgi:phage terminase small subunit
MVLNPLGKHMATLDSEIRHLEDRLGLTPRARLQLGITYADAHRSLEERNRALQADENDPR